MFMKKLILLIIILDLILLINCENKQFEQTNNNIKILATTNIIADVVENICGNLADVKSLLPLGASPHSFEPIPRDIAKIDQADILFINGGGLEKYLEKFINQPDVKKKTISLSENIKFLHSEESGYSEEHYIKKTDPHVWMDPQNVIIWVNTIEHILCEKDSGNCVIYKENAHIYRTRLKELDVWISDQFKSVDKNNRKIVSDHIMLGYYGNRYGLQQVGAILPGFSSLAEPSAREIARLEDEIRKLNVKALLIGINMSPALAERIGQDTDTKLVRFYTGSLSEKGGPADTYMKYMHYNTRAIVEALN